MRFFYPDFRDSGKHRDGRETELGPRVLVFEDTERYDSGFVLIGAMGLNTAQEIYGKNTWLWLTPEQYAETRENLNLKEATCSTRTY